MVVTGFARLNKIVLSLGFGYVWYSQHVNNIEWFLKSVKMLLIYNSIQERDTILDKSSCSYCQCKIERNCIISVNIFKMSCIYVLNMCNCPSSIVRTTRRLFKY